MPQLDATNYPSLILWLAITFIALYFILRRALLPRIADVLEARQDKIDDDLARVSLLTKEAEEVLAEYEKVLADARGKAQARLQKVSEEMADESAKRNSEVTAKLADDVKAAEDRIEKAKSQAIENLRQTASEVARAATGRIAGIEVDESAADRAVNAVVKGESR